MGKTKTNYIRIKAWMPQSVIEMEGEFDNDKMLGNTHVEKLFTMMENPEKRVQCIENLKYIHEQLLKIERVVDANNQKK